MSAGALARGTVPLPPATVTIDAALPALFAANDRAWRRTAEFFGARIRNANTRAAYLQAVGQFSAWCQSHGIHDLAEVSPLAVAAYIETHPGSPPTVKQHLAALRMLFDWLVIGQVIPSNPASPVRGPKHVVTRGKTPVLLPEEASTLIESLQSDRIAHLRDRALIAIMIYSFARVGAVVGMNLEDYYAEQKRWWFRLHEKNSKRHEVPAHHKAEEYLDAYLDAAAAHGLDRSDGKAPLFRALDRKRQLTDRRMATNDVFRMVKRRVKDCGLSSRISCHSFRATGITAYLLNGGRLELAQQIAAHESPRTTKLYDRTDDRISLDEIERIVI